MIAIVQVASDNLKKANVGESSALHILETTNDLIKTGLAERDDKIRQINLDFERSVEKLNIEFEKSVEKLNIEFEKSLERLQNNWQQHDTSEA